MDLTVRKMHGFVIVRPAGSLESNSAGAFLETVNRLLDEGERWVMVECSATTRVAGAGIRALLMARTRLRAVGGELMIAALSPGMAAAFQLAGVAERLSIAPSIMSGARQLRDLARVGRLSRVVAHLLASSETS